MSFPTRIVLGLPLLNQLMSRFYVPYRHNNMSTRLCKLPANSPDKCNVNLITLIFSNTAIENKKQYESIIKRALFWIWYLAVSEPMQVKLFKGGRGNGLCKWEAMILCKRISCKTLTHPLNHTIHLKPSFFVLFDDTISLLIILFILYGVNKIDREKQKIIYWLLRQIFETW